MAKRKYGRIVNLASIAGLIGPIDLAPYGAAKAGIIGLTRAAALDLADYGITVNAIAPGPIDTELLRLRPADALRERAQHMPIVRLGTVQEIAHAALFLASPDSGFITGTVLVVDGGSVAADPDARGVGGAEGACDVLAGRWRSMDRAEDRALARDVPWPQVGARSARLGCADRARVFDPAAKAAPSGVCDADRSNQAQEKCSSAPQPMSARSTRARSSRSGRRTSIALT